MNDRSPAAARKGRPARGTRPTVLVVEDDSGIAESLIYSLERESFVAHHVGDLTSARARTREADLVVLDLGLPDGDGKTLLTELRNAGDTTPVIVLTSRDEELDRILGLELGADDYVTKPFSPRELVARIKAVLRRVSPHSPARLDGWLIDLDKRMAKFGGQSLELTRRELDLLATLQRRPGHVFTRDRLLETVWGDVVVADRTVDAHVKTLRKKIAAVGAQPDDVETVRGIGYRWRES